MPLRRNGQARKDPRSLLIERPVGLENLDICSACGGKCCQHFSGVCWPYDFVEPYLENLRTAFGSGYYVLDYWEGKFNGEFDHPYFVRIRHKKVLHSLIDPSCGGICIFWSKKIGCGLSFKDRPTMCRVIIPRRSYECDCPKQYEKKDAVKAWLPFQCVLTTLVDEWRCGSFQIQDITC